MISADGASLTSAREMRFWPGGFWHAALYSTMSECAHRFRVVSSPARLQCQQCNVTQTLILIHPIHGSRASTRTKRFNFCARRLWNLCSPVFHASPSHPLEPGRETEREKRVGRLPSLCVAKLHCTLLAVRKLFYYFEAGVVRQTYYAHSSNSSSAARA